MREQTQPARYARRANPMAVDGAGAGTIRSRLAGLSDTIPVVMSVYVVPMQTAPMV